MKTGDIRYIADIDEETGVITFSKLVLRTIQNRKRYNGFEWFPGPVKVCYWVIEVKNLTWVKRSNKHFDWGWAKNIPPEMRRDHLAHKTPPGRPTKKGALMKLLADQRKFKKLYGDGPDPEYPEELSYSVKIKRIQAAIKRLN